MSRAELLLPAGWAPRAGRLVELIDAPDSPAPPGRWRILDAAPGGWWIQPADDAARAWAAGHPQQMLQGCLTSLDGRQGCPERRMVPPGYAAGHGGMVAGRDRGRC